MNKSILTTLLLCLSLTLFAQSVQKVEYYFDTDPGFGKGKALSTSAAGEVTAAIDISSLQDGVHILAIRTLSSTGKWSATTHIPVSILHSSEVQAIEYFFDEDPGFGKGTPLAFTEQGNACVVNTNVDISALTEGVHSLSIRAQNSSGVLGNTTHNLLLKRKPAYESDSIISVQYFWDENSEAKNKLAFIRTEQGADVSAVINGLDTFAIDTKHYLFIEYHTAKGYVSQSCFEVTRIEAPVGTGTEQVTITELKIYPVPFTTQLFIDALGEGDRIVLTDLSGRQLLTATKTEIVGGLQVGHLPAGTYLLTVYQEQNVISKVVVKQ